LAILLRPEKSEYRMLKVAVEIIQHLQELKKAGRHFAPGSLGISPPGSAIRQLQMHP